METNGMKSPSSEYAPLPPMAPGGYPLQTQSSYSSIESSSTASSSQITGFNQPKPVYAAQTNGDPDSEPEDDPGQLLNMWLGELNTLKKGLEPAQSTPSPNPSNNSSLTPPAQIPVNGTGTVVRRRPNKLEPTPEESKMKAQYRCSLINIENTQDHELDAILGELSVLESQFEEELASPSSAAQPASFPSQPAQRKSTPPKAARGQRTDSPDNDSAFCDNVSVLSSSSAASNGQQGPSSRDNGNNSDSNSKSSSSGISSTNSPTNVKSGLVSPQTNPMDLEAKIKAEKIKLAMEKIKEASIKKLFIKVFTADGSSKSLLIDEKMTVGHVTRILAEKNRVTLHPKWSLVELVPDLYMERVYEDNEKLVENCLMWKIDSKNTLWFIERPEKFDLFARPELYLLGTSSSQRGDLMEEHARQELLEEYFSSSGVGAPEVEGFVWLKAESKKSWKKFYFVLRSSGLYYAPKGKKTSKDLVCLSTFDVNQVYYGAGWKKKYKAPTEYCFAIKHPQIQVKTPKYIRYLCVDSEKELHQWVTGIRIAKNGRQIFDNYRSIEEEITHADIDIISSKRLSFNSPNTLQITGNGLKPNGLTNETSSPARTPSSENKSLDSALSSGIVSDMSSASGSNQYASSSSVTNSSVQDESEASDNITPVNTMDRNFGLRRSLSRTSKSSSSSSSGCLSDRSNGVNGEGNAFESDFPAGGTIKKRPNVAPRLPLTSTTWGMVRDSDEDSSDAGGPNVRVGGGGTLLRNAVRHSLRKKQENGSDYGRLPAQLPQQHAAEIHHNDIDPLSAAFESSLNCAATVNNNLMTQSITDDLPLPPPPREESLDQLSRIASADDDLPPPPPEVIVQQNHQEASRLPPSGRPAQQSPYGKPVPAPLPPSLKRNTPSPVPSPKRVGTRRISFDDNVQMISDEGKSVPYQRTIQPPTPKKLYSNEAPNQKAPPREFLSHLRKVLDKKWQVAEKCKVEVGTSPGQVLGFRDNREVINIIGHGQSYSRDDSVGAWVLHSQQYNQYQVEEGPYSTHRVQNHQNHQQQQQRHLSAVAEPLYAIASRNQVANGASPSHYAPPVPQHQPVILREPVPDCAYATSAQINGAGYHNDMNDVANYSTLSYHPVPDMVRQSPSPQPGLSPAHRGSFRTGRPIPPPPPRRSEETQLTTTA